jgi:hypothetical protein
MAKTMETGAAGRGTGRRMAVLAAVTAAVLLTPLIAMQYTKEVNWTASDFAFAGGLVLGVGLLYELAARASGTLAQRAGAGLALAAAFLLIWVNGAVGIIGSERNDANLMYGAVLAAGVVGALVARFRPAGMARAMLLTGLAQAGVGAIAVAGGLGAEDPNWPFDTIGATGLFTVLWLASAWLFGRAAARAE